eukprot:2290744-Prymnesium_polylepis.1
MPVAGLRLPVCLELLDSLPLLLGRVLNLQSGCADVASAAGCSTPAVASGAGASLCSPADGAHWPVTSLAARLAASDYTAYLP